MSRPLDVMLLLALPASGKSEVRRYLASLTPEQCKNEMHLGPTVQLDDYPYVHLMRRVSEELRKRGHDGVFFDSDDLPMKESRDWGTLIQLLNEDFEDLVQKRRVAPASASDWLLERFDAARVKVGAKPELGALPAALRTELVHAISAEASDLVREKNSGVPESLEGRTIVIEAARGGPDGATPPLPAPLGYQYSLAQFSPEILRRASILYVWVTPEESRRKNIERTDPKDPGSILNHGVPMAVMLGDYGCDDMSYLIETSDKPDTVTIRAHGETFHIPVARFDNRHDLTTFVRSAPGKWKADQVRALHEGLAGATAKLAESMANAG
jgi:hypothetical protein